MLQIDLDFLDSLDVSVFREGDQVVVTLWGPFLTEDGQEMLSDKNRSASGTIPPQLLMDIATSVLEYTTEE